MLRFALLLHFFNFYYMFAIKKKMDKKYAKSFVKKIKINKCFHDDILNYQELYFAKICLQ